MNKTLGLYGHWIIFELKYSKFNKEALNEFFEKCEKSSELRIS